MSEIDEARRNCKTNRIHQIGSSMKYRSILSYFDNTPPDVIRTYTIYRKSETEYEYRRTNNLSLWKGRDVEVVVREDGSMYLKVQQSIGVQHYDICNTQS
jgi:hypothetical protein